MHELPWGHWRIGNNREGTLSVFLTIYIYIEREREREREIEQLRMGGEKLVNTTLFPTSFGRGRSQGAYCLYVF